LSVLSSGNKSFCEATKFLVVSFILFIKKWFFRSLLLCQRVTCETHSPRFSGFAVASYSKLLMMHKKVRSLLPRSAHLCLAIPIIYVNPSIFLLSDNPF
jgi:hypothetical protein